MLIIVVFVTSWPLMMLAEPPGSPIVEPANYWWWFLVTASTVGYGDFFPVSPAGHIVGVYVIVGGIATLTTVFAQLIGVIERARGRRRRGTRHVNESGHIVVLGYTPGRTERIVDELLADGDRPLTLCAWEDVPENPMPERNVSFVRGELTDETVLVRAGVSRAHSVLVDARDDNEALALVVTVHHVAPGTHLVAGLRDMARATQLGFINDGIRCVQWHSPRMLTEELQSPGISQVYAELMTHGGGNTYSLELPAAAGAISFGDCQVALGSRFDATILAASIGGQLSVSPPWPTPLPAGSTLYYVSRRKISTDQVLDAFRAHAKSAGKRSRNVPDQRVDRH
jgi:voltage-gated potassium channel